MIVSNATPLLAFARINELRLLEQLVQHLLIPEAVWHEVTDDPSRPGAEAIRLAAWVEVRPVAAIPPELLVVLDRFEPLDDASLMRALLRIELCELFRAGELGSSRRFRPIEWTESGGTASPDRTGDL